jgi:murein DD-endopeptidase MepM/ murein hydrolase activator NlpD
MNLTYRKLMLPATLALAAVFTAFFIGGDSFAQGTTPTPVPTLNLQPSRTFMPAPTQTLEASLTPFRPTRTLTPFPTNTPRPTQTPHPTETVPPTLIASPSPTNPAEDPNNTPPPTWTPPPDDPATHIDDHYHLYRPIGDGGTNYADRTYPYGGTSGGRYQVHHGMDLQNPAGTPILSAGTGTVFYAGDDLTTMFGPTNNYYGNLVVIEHNFRSPDGQPVYSLYGHIERVDVQTGQAVEPGVQIGIVGGTGVAFGPHLHFEVRVGDPYSFAATRNPDLWIFPYRGFGTFAGRVTDASGTPLYNVTIQIRSTRVTRYAFSYADNSVNGDTVFNENFAIGDIPAGYYEIGVNDNGRVRFRQFIYIYPDRTTWLDVQLN